MTKNPKRTDNQATKIRSQSTLKSHVSVAGNANQNSSLVNYNKSALVDGTRNGKLNVEHSVISNNMPTTRRGAALNSAKTVTEGKRGSMQSSAAKEWGLSDMEKAQYGDRCPRGYEKISLLGKGGAAVVWLAKELSTSKQVALKQFPKPRNS